jgi:hypothetical protein
MHFKMQGQNNGMAKNQLSTMKSKNNEENVERTPLRHSTINNIQQKQ